jgi:LisH domain-containing protein ARMC9|eukprot:Stramenopile-MAST_4_protein_4604
MADERIKEAVVEYLRYHNMANTMQCFEVEARQKLKNIASSPRSGASARSTDDMRFRLRREMMTAYDNGLYDRFFVLWEKHVPEDVRDENDIAKKLEFYLHIHFAVNPFRTSFLRKLANEGGAKKAAGMAASAMLSFRKYLDTRGQALSQTPEFLSFYALPYVPNPSEHPSFKHLLKEKWLSEIRHRLERFLDVILESVSLPDMYKTFAAAEAKSEAGEAGFDQAREKQLKEAFFAREEKLKDFARSVYALSIELVQALDRLRAGQPVRDKFMDYARHRLSSFNDVLSAGGTNADARLASPGPAPAPVLRRLDYDSVRADLSMLCDGAQSDTAAGARCCRVLQALRWRLNRARPKSLRHRVLQSYINNDLLGCSGGGSDVLSKLLHSNSANVREYCCRLVNHLASEVAGRSYLLQHGNLLPLLIEVLRLETEDSITRQNALGALQKFSLRRKPQSVMIENDLIVWIASILRRHSESETAAVGPGGEGLLSEYTIEYATALLMNLSVRTLGKIKCEDPKVGILQVMNDLLESDNHQVRTYVNGTLYSVLTRSVLKDQALEMGMDEMLRRLMTHSDDEFKRQIEYILNQLKKDTVMDDASDGDDDEEEEDADDQDDDDEEPEEDDEETLAAPSGTEGDEFEGEGLLGKKYASEDGGNEVYVPPLRKDGGQPAQHTPGGASLPEAFARPPSANKKRIESKTEEHSVEGKTAEPGGKAAGVRFADEEEGGKKVDSPDDNGFKSSLERTTRAEEERNRMVPSEELQSKPRIARTPLTNDYGYVEPGEFGQKYEDEDQKAAPKLRYNKQVDPEYEEAFIMRPKLSRTPNGDPGMAEEGEFGY